VLERHRRDHVCRWRGPLVRLLLVTERDPDRVILDLADAAELVDEVHVPGLAAQLAVGHRAQPDLTLHPDHLADGSVLGRRELGGGDAAGPEVRSRLQQPGRSQQAADVVRAKRRPGRFGHNMPPYAGR
jgi:hypothetical protein